MANGDSYSWIGGGAGAWDTATNWEDLTTGTVAAVPPGIDNDVTIADVTTLSGGGSAASLTITSEAYSFTVTLLGDINTGGLTLAGDFGSLNVVDGGTLQANSVSLVSTFYGNVISVDASSVIEVGNAGSAALGALKVDADSTLSGEGEVDGAIIDNGLITGSELSLGNFGAQPSLSGSGTVDVPTSGDIFVYDQVTAAGLTFELDGDDTLTIETPIAAGNTIDLLGTEGTIDIPSQSLGMPSVDATITGFRTSDVILISDNLNGEIYSWSSLSYADGTLTLYGYHSASIGTYTLNIAGNYSSDAFEFTDNQQAIILKPGSTPACFAAGTRLATPFGELAVEDLSTANRVMTLSGREEPVQWVGRRRVDCRRHPDPRQVWPVRVRAGAVDDGIPCRDLWLSPDHAVFANDILIPIKRLINGTTIAQVPVDAVTYYHVELPRHDVLLAEGMPAESYLDVSDRSNFANGGFLLQMHPDFALDKACEAKWEAASCAPLRIEGEAFDGYVEHLRRRAVLLGQGFAREKQWRPVSRRVKETDLARLLDPDWYLANNPDVASAAVDAAVHYVNWGNQEGRLPCDEVELVRALGLVDPGSLIFTMADVIDAGVDPVAHFCHIGWRERRRPNLYFDTGWYIDTHDVPAGMNPLLHYVLLGESRGMPPSRHFDPGWYRQRYLASQTDSPLAHYLKHRRMRRFSPLPTFDVAAYVRDAKGLRPGRDPYAHFLAIGRAATTRIQQNSGTRDPCVQKWRQAGVGRPGRMASS